VIGDPLVVDKDHSILTVLPSIVEVIEVGIAGM
jgi:hypothetical protein